MSDRIPDVMKMLDETPCKATPREELRNQIMSSIIPKNEREWCSKRTIEQLERELNAANQRIEELEREIDRLNMRILSLEVAGQNVVYQATEMWKRGAIKEWLDLVRKEEDKP